MSNYQKDQVLVKYRLSMPKQYSSFLYFILESNENVCFYSTEPAEIGQVNRVVNLHATPEQEHHLENILKHCQARNPELILEGKVVINDRAS